MPVLGRGPGVGVGGGGVLIVSIEDYSLTTLPLARVNDEPQKVIGNIQLLLLYRQVH